MQLDAVSSHPVKNENVEKVSCAKRRGCFSEVVRNLGIFSNTFCRYISGKGNFMSFFFPLGYSWSFYFLQGSAKTSLGWQSSIAIFCDTQLTMLPNRPWTWNSYTFILILPKHPKILLLPHSLCKEDTQRDLLSPWLRGNGCLQFLLYQHCLYSSNRSVCLVFSKSSFGKQQLCFHCFTEIQDEKGVSVSPPMPRHPHHFFPCTVWKHFLPFTS